MSTSIALLVCLLGSLWNFGSGRDLLFSKKWLCERVWGKNVYIAGTLTAFPTLLYPQNTGILLVKATPHPCFSF